MNMLVAPTPSALRWGVAASFCFVFVGMLMMLVSQSIYLVLASTFLRAMGECHVQKSPALLLLLLLLSRWAAVAAVVQQMEHLLCRQRHSVGVLDASPAEACAQRAAGEDFRYIRSAMRLAVARVYVYCTICVRNTAIQIAQWAPLAL